MKVFYKNAQINNPIETDYENVRNRTKINNVLLEGDQNTEEIKVTWFGTLEEFELLPEKSPTTIYIIDDSVQPGKTKNYFFKIRKPHINGIELEGAKISSDLDMYTRDEVDNLIASMRSLKVVNIKPPAPLPNTMYYVGPRIHPGTGEEIYDVYLYDSLLTELYLGTTFTQVLKTGGGSSVKNNVVSTEPDTISVNTNTDNQLQIKWLADKTVGVNDSKPVYLQNSVLKSFTHNIFDLVYPVGTIYQTTALSAATQVAAKFGGTWEALNNNYFLVNTTNGDAGTLVNEQLPNITGKFNTAVWDDRNTMPRDGAFIGSGKSSIYMSNRSYQVFSGYKIAMNAHSSNSIYTDNGVVRPNSLQVYMYKRVA